MNITLANPDDATELAELRWAFQLEEPTETASVSKEAFIKECSEFVKTSLESGTWKCWVAKENSEIVSHIFLQKVALVPKPQNLNDKYFGYVTNTYTKPEFRNKGIGKELIDELIKYSKSQNFDTLIVWPSEKSIEWYKRAGFSQSNEIFELN